MTEGNDLPVCDVCGKPATHGAQDLRETKPVRGKDGELWATWEPASEWHWRCNEHKIESHSFDLDGNEIETPELMKTAGHHYWWKFPNGKLEYSGYHPELELGA